MTPRERRRAAKARVQALATEARTRAEALPLVKKARRKRALRRAIGALVIVLLLLFLRCDCGPPASVEPPELDAGVMVDAGTVAAKPHVRPRPRSTEHLASSERGQYDTGTRRSPQWLDEFRMQVAARSPRLAQCFKGAERPGALRWDVALNPSSGAVSDQFLETVGAVELSAPQRECVERTLSNPGYHVSALPSEGLPTRVTLMIEF